MELTNRTEMGSCNMGSGLLRLIARNLLFPPFRIHATHEPEKEGGSLQLLGQKIVGIPYVHHGVFPYRLLLELSARNLFLGWGAWGCRCGDL